MIAGALLLAAAAALLVQFLVFRSQTYALLGPDFIDYAFQSEVLSSGRFPPVLVKPAGCALWIAFHRAIFGEHIAGYRTFCIAAIALLPLLSGLIGYHFSGWSGAILATGMVIVSPASLHVSLLAETPATFFLAAALVAALCSARAQRRPAKYALGAAAGLLSFLSFQSRPDYLMYLPATAALLVLAVPVDRVSTRSAWRHLLVFSGTCALLMGVQSCFTAPEYGSHGMVRYDAYLRYFTVFQDMKLQPPANEMSVRQIRESLVRAGVEPERASGQDDLGFTRAWFVVRSALEESGLTWAQADRTMNAAAISAIEANPRAYLTRAAATFGNFLLFREAIHPQRPARAPAGIEVPPAVYARLHDLHFHSDAAQYGKAMRLYEELRASAPQGASVLPWLRAF
jgi:hypothetical protein